MKQHPFLIASLLSLSCFSCSFFEIEPMEASGEPIVKTVSHFSISPSFPGGQDSLLVYLANNLRWPSPDFCGGGTAIITFTVDIDGAVTNPEVVRSIYKLLDEEALRIVSQMPAWKPGEVNGVASKMQVLLPLRFSLQ